MITITQEEANALNIIGQQAIALQNQVNQMKAAQGSVIVLLENKYDATFDPASGELKPKEAGR